mmetsp:Transcript_20009/g.20130  ORF Transcript_20009/g.20130 Transcript_20009/m.20130 type:complete len:154 (+) Transcript_20009:2-463(+)
MFSLEGCQLEDGSNGVRWRMRNNPDDPSTSAGDGTAPPLLSQNRGQSEFARVIQSSIPIENNFPSVSEAPCFSKPRMRRATDIDMSRVENYGFSRVPTMTRQESSPQLNDAYSASMVSNRASEMQSSSVLDGPLSTPALHSYSHPPPPPPPPR